MAVRIGGQAVIEGVMMKNMDRYAVSVRKPDGKIETKVEECVSFAEKHPLFKLPILLGTSRKSVIGLTLDLPADEREEGTLVTTVYAVQKRCAFVRVHDVEKNKRAILMTQALMREHEV